MARRQLESMLAEVFDRPTRIDELAISVLPPQVHVGGVAVGTEPTVLARIGSIDARLWVIESLKEGRPVLSGQVGSVALDLRQLPPRKTDAHEQQGKPGRFPLLRVREVELTQGRVLFRFQNADAALSLAQVRGELKSSWRTRQLAATLDVAAVQIERRAVKLNLAQAHVEGGASAHGLFLKTGNVTGDGISIAMTPASHAREYNLSAAVDLGGISGLVDQSIQGEAKIDGRVTGDLANPDLNVQVSIRNLAIDQHGFGDVKTRVVRQARLLRMTDLDLTGPLGHVTAVADLNTTEKLPIEGTVSLGEINLDTVLAAFGQHVEIGDEVSGTLAVSGTLHPLDLNIKATGEVLAGASEPSRTGPETVGPAAGSAGSVLTAMVKDPESAQAGRERAAIGLDAHVEGGGGTVQLEVEQSEKNHLTAMLAWKDTQIAGPVQLHVRDLQALSALLPKPVRDLGLTGQSEVTATLSGSLMEPKLQASIMGKDLTVMGVAVPRLVGDISIEHSTLNTSSVRIDTAGGDAELTGTIALGRTAENDWRLEVRSLETDLVTGIVQTLIRSTLPVSGGKLNGAVRARGAWGRAVLEANVTAQGVYLAQEPVEQIDIKATTELPRWTAHVSLVHAATETVTIDGSGGDATGVQVAINSTPFQLENLRGAGRRDLTGTVAVHGEISGKPPELSGSLRVIASHVGVSSRQLGDMTIQAAGRQGEWTLTGFALENAVEIEATLRTTNGYPYTLGAHLRALEFGRLLSNDQSLVAVVTGDIDLKGAMKDWATPNGTVHIPQLDIRRDQYEVAAQQPIRIDVIEGRFLIRSMVLAAPSSQLSISGELGLSGQVDLQARGEGNLVLLELIGRPVNSARGQFTVSVQARRQPMSGWDLSGEAQFRDTALDLGLLVAFTDVNGDFALAGSSVRIVNLDGKAGGGQFHVGGTLSLDEGPNVSWEIQEVALSTSQGLEAQVSGVGQIQGTWREIAVGGNVEVLSALYDRNIELTDFLPFFREQITPAPRTKPPSTRVHLNVRIHAPGGVHIDNNVAEVELGADLRLVGTIDQPQLTGTIEFLSGQVKFKQRMFTITGGSIDFRDRGRINPILNISAESQISTAEADYTVSVSIAGTAENPRVQLSADDPMLSETDIVSLITLGQTAAQLQRQGGGISAIDAVALLPTGTVTGPVAKIIGVNRLEIETVQSPIAGSAGSIEPRVTIGKDLTERLRAAVSTTFGIGTERMVQLEYRLTRQMSLLGTWEGQTSQQSGAFGGDIKFHYEFRKVPFSLLPRGLETTAGGDVQ
ncbi:MAG: translocation/assembly module TamB domain-containing protein [Candidatus Binatia bacterium]